MPKKTLPPHQGPNPYNEMLRLRAELALVEAKLELVTQINLRQSAELKRLLNPQPQPSPSAPSPLPEKEF